MRKEKTTLKNKKAKKDDELRLSRDAWWYGLEVLVFFQSVLLFVQEHLCQENKHKHPTCM